MKTEAKLLLGLGLCFFLMGVTYWFWSHENAGSMMLVASGGLYARLAALQFDR